MDGKPLVGDSELSIRQRFTGDSWASNLIKSTREKVFKEMLFTS
jgi:hypothetical protein